MQISLDRDCFSRLLKSFQPENYLIYCLKTGNYTCIAAFTKKQGRPLICHLYYQARTYSRQAFVSYGLFVPTRMHASTREISYFGFVPQACTLWGGTLLFVFIAALLRKKFSRRANVQQLPWSLPGTLLRALGVRVPPHSFWETAIGTCTHVLRVYSK
jgi:hypothetical protein